MILPLQRDLYCSQILTQSTYLLGTDPSKSFLDQVTVSISDVEQETQNITTLWPDQPSDNSLYEAATKFSDEAQDNQMFTEVKPEPLLQPHKKASEPLEGKLVSTILSLCICLLFLRHLV